MLPRLLLLGVLWGITFPVARLGVAAGANPFLLVAAAFGIATLLAAPAALLRHAALPSARSLAASAAVGALLIGGINLPLFWGVRFATGGVASIIYATSPLVSLGILALLGSGQRVGPRTVAALVLGVLGVAVLAFAAGGAAVTSVWGLAAFGLGTVCQGAGAVALGRLRPTGETPWGETFQFVGGGAASLVVVAAIAPTLTLPATAPVLVSLVYVGAVSMAAGYALFFDLLRRGGAVGANQVTLLNPIVAVAFGALLLGEPFAPEEPGGLVLILLALVLLHLPGRGPRGAAAPRRRSDPGPLRRRRARRPEVSQALEVKPGRPTVQEGFAAWSTKGER